MNKIAHISARDIRETADLTQNNRTQYCLQDVNQIERGIRSNGAFRSNRQFRSNQISLHSADMTYISLCYDLLICIARKS